MDYADKMQQIFPADVCANLEKKLLKKKRFESVIRAQKRCTCDYKFFETLILVYSYLLFSL